MAESTPCFMHAFVPRFHQPFSLWFLSKGLPPHRGSRSMQSKIENTMFVTSSAVSSCSNHVRSERRLKDNICAATTSHQAQQSHQPK